MQRDRSVALACGGLAAMAAALGIGRFVYTPILPVMLAALGWSKADAGLIASANFLGYFIGALLAGWPVVVARPRLSLLIALAVSALTTAGMAAPSDIASFLGLRFVGGIASAVVIVCASTLVLERLSASGRGALSAIHFAGVGFGIAISAIAVSALLAAGADWRQLWIGTGAIAMLAVIATAVLIPAADSIKPPSPPDTSISSFVGAKFVSVKPEGLGAMIAANGLFGFGYVITTTFLVALVRLTDEVRVLEPWVWVLFGLAAVPSVTLWCRLGERIGIMNAFAVACVVEAVAVAASVEWLTITGICVSTVLLGGTFMGITALGLMAARNLSGGRSQQAIGRMTASFAIGQMLGPTFAGMLFERLGSFRVASLIATVALIIAAALALRISLAADRRSRIALDTAGIRPNR
jgi:predicted MFS family arabinose efflux permease